MNKSFHRHAFREESSTTKGICFIGLVSCAFPADVRGTMASFAAGPPPFGGPENSDGQAGARARRGRRYGKASLQTHGHVNRALQRGQGPALLQCWYLRYGWKNQSTRRQSIFQSFTASEWQSWDSNPGTVSESGIMNLHRVQNTLQSRALKLAFNHDPQREYMTRQNVSHGNISFVKHYFYQVPCIQIFPIVF